MDLIILFISSLLAATLVPAQSEAVLATIILGKEHDVAMLVLVATTGNVLGATINWMLGRYLEQIKNQRWFPAKKSSLEKAERTYQLYGVWTLLFSWVPFIGDPLTMMAGFLRTPFPLFLVLVTIGKLARYIVIALIAQ